jgi:hypothetical protein
MYPTLSQDLAQKGWPTLYSWQKFHELVSKCIAFKSVYVYTSILSTHSTSKLLVLYFIRQWIIPRIYWFIIIQIICRAIYIFTHNLSPILIVPIFCWFLITFGRLLNILQPLSRKPSLDSDRFLSTGVEICFFFFSNTFTKCKCILR